MSLENNLPNLAFSKWSVTSPASHVYNCIAWAAGNDSDWWWPVEDAHWPTEDRIATVEAFVKAFAALGFTSCNNGSLEEGFEKVALFVKDDRVTHAARQLPNGQWTSKLGRDVDIEHELTALDGELYGIVTQFLRRPTSSQQNE